jgi:hypothetical protein
MQLPPPKLAKGDEPVDRASNAQRVLREQALRVRGKGKRRWRIGGVL